VFVNGTFIMSGGEISGNTVGLYFYNSGGGGVYVSGGTFTKTGGTIYGYTSGDANSNTVNKSDGIQDERGHAVYLNNSPPSYRDTTAGPTVNLDSKVAGAAGGWE